LPQFQSFHIEILDFKNILTQVLFTKCKFGPTYSTIRESRVFFGFPIENTKGFYIIQIQDT